MRGYAVTHPPATVVLPSPPGWDHLLYASAGVMTVESDSGTWVVPPHRALWAPDGTPFRLVMHGRVSVRTLYFAAELAVLPSEWRAVNVSPLVRELILHAVRTAPLDLDAPDHAALVRVLVDQLVTLPQAPLELPMPTDPRARALAVRLEEAPGAPDDVPDLARDVGASRRTLERLFVAETGMTIGRWRTRARMIEALRLLAEGHPVSRVAVEVGYSTPSAFGVAFRQELGASPSRYFSP